MDVIKRNCAERIPSPMMFRCRFFCAAISRDFRNLRLAFFLSSHLSLFFPLFRIVLRRESERLKAVRFISMLIYICIFARFFQHFRDFHFLPLTSRVRVSLHPLFLCKIQKATLFLSFSFSSILSISLYLSLVLYPPPSPATLFFHLPRFYQTQ